MLTASSLYWPFKDLRFLQGSDFSQVRFRVYLGRRGGLTSRDCGIKVGRLEFGAWVG